MASSPAGWWKAAAAVIIFLPVAMSCLLLSELFSYQCTVNAMCRLHWQPADAAAFSILNILLQILCDRFFVDVNSVLSSSFFFLRSKPSPCLWPITPLCVSWSGFILNMWVTTTWLFYSMNLTSLQIQMVSMCACLCTDDNTLCCLVDLQNVV